VESWTTARARLAAHGRHHPDEDRTELRRRLRVIRAASYLRLVVADQPTDSERLFLLGIITEPTREVAR
jgi:hypothetical protein